MSGIQIQPIHKSVQGTILSGQDITGVIDSLGATLIGIVTPAALNGTTFEFQASDDGTTFLDYFTANGSLVSGAMGVDRYIALFPQDLAPARFFKFKSGSTETADRIFQFIFRPL